MPTFIKLHNDYSNNRICITFRCDAGYEPRSFAELGDSLQSWVPELAGRRVQFLCTEAATHISAPWYSSDLCFGSTEDVTRELTRTCCLGGRSGRGSYFLCILVVRFLIFNRLFPSLFISHLYVFQPFQEGVETQLLTL